MAGNINWQSGAVISFASQLSGQGAQLLSGAAVLCSGNLINTGQSGGPAFFGFAEFVSSQSGFAAAVSALNTVDLYLVPSRDGTNYMDADTAGPVLPPQHFKGSFVITKSGNSQMRLGVDGIPLLPIDYKAYIQNNGGQTLTSGWTLNIDCYSQAYT